MMTKTLFNEILDEYKFNDVLNEYESYLTYELYIKLYKELATSSILLDASENNTLTINSFKECIKYSNEYLIEEKNQRSVYILMQNYI